MNKQNIFCIQHSVFSNKQHIEMQKNDSTRNTNKSSLLPVRQERVDQTRIDQGIRSNSAGLQTGSAGPEINGRMVNADTYSKLHLKIKVEYMYQQSNI